MSAGDLEAPGDDVRRLQARTLGTLLVAWRLRLELGGTEIDATSSHGLEARGWNRAETLAVLAAALDGRLDGAAAARAAAGRVRLGATRPSTWDQISAGAIGVDPATIPGTVGRALEILGARLVGAWSGERAGVTDSAPAPAKRARKARAKR